MLNSIDVFQGEDPPPLLQHAALLDSMKKLSVSQPMQGPTNVDSLSSNMTSMVIGETEERTEDIFLASLASHSLPLPLSDEPQQTLQNLQQQQQQLVQQQQQLELQLKRMQIEENTLWDKSEQYQKQFAQYQQLLGHQQAQVELQLHQLALHHKYATHCQKEILPGACWM